MRHIADRWPETRSCLEVVKRLPAAAVRRVVDHPVVGEWATRTALGSGPPAGFGLVAAAAAVHAGASMTVELPDVEQALLPTLGRLVGRPHGKVAVDDLRWQPTPRVEVPGGPTFLLEGWIDGGPPTRLPVSEDIDVARWQEAIAGAWAILASDHEDVAAEFATAITALTPLDSPRSGINSATHADAFGCIFLSLPEDPETTAMTLAHELQHTKLVALMDLFPLVTPDSGERFYAPWREDPRPAIGLLHGAYAHLGVAGFCRKVGRDVEFARWRSAALEVSNTLLASSALTDLGRDFVHGMASTLSSWCAEPVSEAARAQADLLAEEHRSRWLTFHHKP
ncbi:aKG-HExxH-type peptide beta-hydroxylase [Saccharothrix variisporea]|uniref:aKG-HExxH-type peptide beta-hydroxylase n=1 Tax=Saccharothrix variisporea TaxID=543527 RepID=UPI001FEAC798|nr:HEXXH motif-containing putative peptide modification protein [Saccharothrix variisporea]